MLKVFSLLYCLRKQNFLQQKRDCILEKMNIDMENHFNDSLILCGSTIIVKAIPFCLTFSFKRIINNTALNVNVSIS